MNKKGIALISCYMVIAVLLVLSTSYFIGATSEGRIALKDAESSRAFWVAEAGMQQGIYSIKNSAWNGWTAVDTSTKTITSVLGGSGEYSVTVSGLAGDTVTISSTGYSPSQADKTNSQRTVISAYTKSSPFNCAVFGINNVTLGGNASTDSYNSLLGAYGWVNRGVNGDVGTNGTENGAVTLSGNARVNGDANTGSSGTVVASGNSRVSGTVTHDNTSVPSTVTIPTNLSSLSSSGSRNISGNSSQTISAGNYKLSSISVSGNATLTLSGDVNIYLTGSSSLSVSGNGRLVVAGTAKIYVDGVCIVEGNGIVNNHKLPSNCLIYGSNSSSVINFTGNGNFYGPVYAPDASINVSGNGQVFGALTGKNVNLSGNGKMHYDEALSQVGAGGYTFESWEET